MGQVQSRTHTQPFLVSASVTALPRDTLYTSQAREKIRRDLRRVERHTGLVSCGTIAVTD